VLIGPEEFAFDPDLADLPLEEREALLAGEEDDEAVDVPAWAADGPEEDLP
jgi:hypothetical protein